MAIVILAGALAALSYGSAIALRGQARAETQTAAVHQARAALATVGRTSALLPGEQRTELANGWRQLLIIRPLTPWSSERKAPQPYDVRLIIQDQAGRELANLATVRVAPPR